MPLALCSLQSQLAGRLFGSFEGPNIPLKESKAISIHPVVPQPIAPVEEWASYISSLLFSFKDSGKGKSSILA
jgi:hypothetical protein